MGPLGSSPRAWGPRGNGPGNAGGGGSRQCLRATGPVPGRGPRAAREPPLSFLSDPTWPAT